MEFTYTLEEDDYLQFQLFTASHSPRIKKRKFTGWTILTAASVIALIYSITESNNDLILFFSITSVLIVTLYPPYFKWKFKKHYIKFIRENYGGRVGTSESIDFQEKHIYLKDKTGEGKVKYKELESIHEIPNHYFLKISNGNSIIIPKEMQNISELKKQLDKLSLKRHDFTLWKW